jgi:hypothetical protein
MVSINNVNDGQSWTGPPTGPCMHCQYYVNNFSGTTIVYNGFTTVLPAQYPVVPYMTYHVKIGIADVGDPSYDSAIFLEASSLTTAVKDYSNANKMLLYPNPAINTLTIERPQSAVIEITNIQGQIIKTIAATGNKTNVDVSSFPCGMYIVEMKTDKGIEVKKFVKE